MNVKLLRRIQKQILKEPRQFYMQCWFQSGPLVPWKVPNCGTAACIGGWALALHHNSNPAEVAERRCECKTPEQVLELDWFQEDRLFYEREWPKRFQGGKTPLQRAKKAVARIDHFIKTKGKE